MFELCDGGSGELGRSPAIEPKHLALPVRGGLGINVSENYKNLGGAWIIRSLGHQKPNENSLTNNASHHTGCDPRFTIRDNDLGFDIGFKGLQRRGGEVYL
jgi:hypothetical protein